jgi:hypothetical protein
MPVVTTKEHRLAAQKLREIYAVYIDAEDFVYRQAAGVKAPAKFIKAQDRTVIKANTTLVDLPKR